MPYIKIYCYKALIALNVKCFWTMLCEKLGEGGGRDIGMGVLLFVWDSEACLLCEPYSVTDTLPKPVRP